MERGQVTKAIMRKDSGKTQDPIMVDPVTGSIQTLSLDTTRENRPKVGLRGWPGRRFSPAELLAARTTKDPITGCWNCSGHLNHPNGYPQISIGPERQRHQAHRLAWQLAHPEHQFTACDRVLHSCDNTRCVNPDHLRLGTQCENIRESIQKGRYNTYGIQKLNGTQVLE